MSITTVDFTKKNRLEKRYSHIYSKVQRIFKDYYSASLNYCPFPEVINKDDKALKGLLTNNDPLILGDKTLFPIHVDEEIVGFAEVKSKSRILNEEAKKMRQTIDLLLTKSLRSSKRLKELKEIENKFVTDHNDGVDTVNNVYSIETGLSIKEKFQDLQKPLFEKSFSPRNISLDQSCMIFARNVEERFKLANEIHYISNRYAFINFNALDKKDLDIEGLNGIGSVSLFIDELSFLSKKEQELILEFLKQRKDATQPQFITCSTVDYKSLSQHPDMNKELVDLLSSVKLAMTSTFKEYKSQDLSQFFATQPTRDH